MDSRYHGAKTSRKDLYEFGDDNEENDDEGVGRSESEESVSNPLDFGVDKEDDMSADNDIEDEEMADEQDDDGDDSDDVEEEETGSEEEKDENNEEIMSEFCLSYFCVMALGCCWFCCCFLFKKHVYGPLKIFLKTITCYLHVFLLSGK